MGEVGSGLPGGAGEVLVSSDGGSGLQKPEVPGGLKGKIQLLGAAFPAGSNGAVLAAEIVGDLSRLEEDAEALLLRRSSRVRSEDWIEAFRAGFAAGERRGIWQGLTDDKREENPVSDVEASLAEYTAARMKGERP